MEYFTARNTVILALFQEGVITLGVLAAGLAFKSYSLSGLPVPASTSIATDYGWVLLILPLVWVIFAYRTLERPDSTPRARFVAVTSGVAFLGLLLVGAWNVGVGRALLRLFSH